MIIDTEKLLKLLLESDESSYSIAPKVGCSRMLISTIRNGTKKPESLTIDKAYKIQSYLEQTNKP